MTEEKAAPVCKGRVRFGNWGRDRPCQKKCGPDGFCPTHRPENVEARKARSEERFQLKLKSMRREMSQAERDRALIEAGRQAVTMLEDAKGFLSTLRHNSINEEGAVDFEISEINAAIAAWDKAQEASKS